jgi:hypothetical protein
MTATTANLINLFNSLPQREQDEVRFIINRNNDLRTELNCELEQSKESPVLSDSDAEAEWNRFGVKAI